MRPRISKAHTIRSNGPLKSLAQVGSNMTVIEHGNLIILYSYETPVALLAPGGGYMTEKKWSTTTSKHIGKFFAAYGYDKRGAAKIPQEDIEAFARAGKAKGAAGMTGAEFVERTFPKRDNRPRRTARRRALIRDMQFFRQHGGGVVGEAARGALDLSRAEREAERRGWAYTYEPEQESYEDVYGEKPPEGAEFVTVVLWDRDPEDRSSRLRPQVLASLGFVDANDRNYLRVVRAELASEALSR